MAEVKQSPKDGRFYMKNTDGSWSPVIKVSPVNGKSYVQVGKNDWEELVNEQNQEPVENSLSPVTAMKNLAKNSGPILNALDLERRYISPAAIMTWARPDLLEESERGAGFSSDQRPFPTMGELLDRKAAKSGETELEKSMNSATRHGLGFLADLVTPSTLVSALPKTWKTAIGVTRAAESFPKVADTLKFLGNPVGEAMGFASSKPAESIGNYIYDMPFRKIDATADTGANVKRISEIAKQYGITGDYRSILRQLREKMAMEGKNIENSIGLLQEKISPAEIMQISDGAASKNLGQMQDRERILNFIEDELDLMTPPTHKEAMAKYAAERGRYNKAVADANNELIAVNKYSPEYLQTLQRQRDELSTVAYNSKEYWDLIKRHDQELSGINQFTPEYSLKLAQQNEQIGGQGTLFDRPKTENYVEKVPFITETRTSKVVGGDFMNFPSSPVKQEFNQPTKSVVVGGDFTAPTSEMGTFKFTEPAQDGKVVYWETDPRSGVQRGFGSPPRYATNKTAPNQTAGGLILSGLEGPSQAAPAGLPVGIPNNYSQRPQMFDFYENGKRKIIVPDGQRDFSGPLLMTEGRPNYQGLPVGEGTNYSPRPQLVDEVVQNTEMVPLSTPSARDAADQIPFMAPKSNAPLLAPQMPDDKVFSFADLFDLKKSTATKGYKGVTDKTTGATSPIAKRQASEIEQALYARIKDQAKKELSKEEADALLASINNYSQFKKNKDGFRQLITSARQEPWNPADFGITNVGDLGSAIPSGWGVRLATRTGKTLAQPNPWMVNILKQSVNKPIPLMMRDYEE